MFRKRKFRKLGINDDGYEPTYAIVQGSSKGFHNVVNFFEAIEKLGLFVTNIDEIAQDYFRDSDYSDYSYIKIISVEELSSLDISNIMYEEFPDFFE
jgi:hypothetical protein